MSPNLSLPSQPQSVAIIGTGISGMSAAWMISKHHVVTVFEKNWRLGGHSNTVEAPTGDGAVPVDTGFIVFNDRNYPNLVALFDHLGVETSDSDMSFAASIDNGALEYSGTDLNGLIGQRRNVFNLRYWRMIRDILRFYREAPALLRDNSGVFDDIPLGEYLAQNKYSPAFIEDHLLPMGAAIWSTRASDMLAYPARAFVRFFDSHGLLTLTDRPQWKSVVSGSWSYVEKLTASYRNAIRLGAGAVRVRRDGEKVIVTDEQGHTQTFDHVVIAAHADEALTMLEDPDGNEQSILGAFQYTDNRAVLHKDASLMPQRRRVWSSWNYLSESGASEDDALCVTYWMNRLQQLPTQEDIFVTLNPMREPETIIKSIDYQHPLFNSAALAAQGRLSQIQGARNTWFCGAYFGHGFHEDGLQSGLAVGEMLTGARRPWVVEGESNRIAHTFAREIAAE